jgi:hypothetical protein
MSGALKTTGPIQTHTRADFLRKHLEENESTEDPILWILWRRGIYFAMWLLKRRPSKTPLIINHQSKNFVVECPR